MKKLLSIMMALFICGATLLSAQPQLVIENDGMYDWGNVKPEQGTLHASVKLWNKGNKTLEIKRTKPGCGCTTDSLDMNKVAPGKYATLKVHLNISGYQGNTIKSVRISSDDPEKPEQNLLLKCNVMVPVLMTPKYLGFNRLVVNEEASVKSIITNNTEKPMKITSFELKMDSKDVDASDLKHNVRKGTIIESKANYSIEMKFKPKNVGRLQSKLIIQTDSKESPTIELPIWGNIVADNEKK